MEYTFKTQGVCAQFISFELDGDNVKNIQFVGGCSGNLKAIAKLVDGCKIDFVVEKLKGNTCGYKNTSCADQLAIALEQAYEKENVNIEE